MLGSEPTDMIAPLGLSGLYDCWRIDNLFSTVSAVAIQDSAALFKQQLEGNSLPKRAKAKGAQEWERKEKIGNLRGGDLILLGEGDRDFKRGGSLEKV